jgi:hypothetical protein
MPTTPLRRVQASGATNRFEALDQRVDGYEEVFAAYGQAMFYAQHLERELIRLIWASRLYTTTHPTDLERLIKDLEYWTMGRSLRAALAEVPVDKRLRHRLYISLRLRNRLVHSYFNRKDGERLLTPRGRRGMLDELNRAGARFRNVVEALCPITDRELKKKGIPIEKLAAEVDHRIDELVRKGEADWADP